MIYTYPDFAQNQALRAYLFIRYTRHSLLQINILH
jgi:hypothetical protein